MADAAVDAAKGKMADAAEDVDAAKGKMADAAAKGKSMHKNSKVIIIIYYQMM